jgi:hypothetical protein
MDSLNFTDFSNRGKGFYENNKFLSGFLVGFLILGMIWMIVSLTTKEGFLSGGTISQLFAKDSQDLMLNGDEIKPYASGDFQLNWYQPTQVNHPQRGDQIASDGTKFYLDAYTGDYHPIPDKV